MNNFRPIFRSFWTVCTSFMHLFWKFGLFQGHFGQFHNKFKAVPSDKMADLTYTPSEQERERRKIWVQARPNHINSTSTYKPCESKGERGSSTLLMQGENNTLIYIPYSKRERGTGTVQAVIRRVARPGMVQAIIRRVARPGTVQAIIWRAAKTQSAGQAETPTPAGRDPHPLGRQPGHQGERALVKETSCTQRLQPVH